MLPLTISNRLTGCLVYETEDHSQLLAKFKTAKQQADISIRAPEAWVIILKGLKFSSVGFQVVKNVAEDI